MDEKTLRKVQSHIDDGAEVPPELVEQLHADSDDEIDEDAYQSWLKTKGEGR